MPLFGPPNIAQLEAKRDIQGLIKALTYKDPEVKIAAADALGPLGDPMAVEPLAFLIGDEDAGVRRAAVRALSARGGVRVVEPLIAALQDNDPGVRGVATQAVYRRLMTDPDQDARRETVMALGRIKAADAVEPLVKAIMDPDETVRVASVKSLASIGDVAAVAPLIVMLAHEQYRAKTTGRSSLAVERAASQALDALCTENAIDALQSALGHDDAEVRELAVKRLARIGSPLVSNMLEAHLSDDDPIIRRSAARGLAEVGWEPPSQETGARYWAALREWRRCAECGAAAIPLLVAAFPRAQARERSDILAALASVGWQPSELDATAASFWASQGNWEKCVEVGTPAVEVLDGIVNTAPRWRERAAAAAALRALGEERVVPFARVQLVEHALGVLDGEGSDDEKRASLTTFLAEEHQFEPHAKQKVEWCQCGYPSTRIRKDGTRDLITDVLGFEQDESNAPAYFCPNCDARRTAEGI
ncbi:MAG: HEAT repeat domain-containing protein [Candidatus Limnocylindrales bacterium]|jgi:HEAT repeat protein